MTITLTPELEQAIAGEAEKCSVTSEKLIADTLRAKFLPEVLFAAGSDPLDEWELEISAAAVAVEAVTAQKAEEQA